MDVISLGKYRVRIFNSQLAAGIDELSILHDNRELAQKLGYDGKETTACKRFIGRLKKQKVILASRFPLLLKCLAENKQPYLPPDELTKDDIDIYRRKGSYYKPTDPEIFNSIIQVWCKMFYDRKG